MRIVDVTTYVLKLESSQVYLGAQPDGTTLTPHDGYVARPPWRSLYSARYETVLVRVTAADGTTGWGEALAPVGPEVVATVVDRLLAPVLLELDVHGVRPAMAALRALMRERGHLVGHQADALAAVDIALWDLVGKRYGAGVAELLGGAFRQQVPVYVSGLPEPTDAGRATLAARWVRDGATAVKLHLGHGVDADLATYDAVAAAAPALRIAVDAHWAYGHSEAIRLGRALDERGALFLEAPLPPEDLAGHAELRSRIVTPVAVGETLRNRYEFGQWIDARAVELLQPDVARTGITEAMAAAELAAAHHLPTAPHHSVGLGVALAAGVHVAAAVEELSYLEFQPGPLTTAQRILTEPLGVRPDAISLPTGPGLGIEVDLDFVTTHAETNPEEK